MTTIEGKFTRHDEEAVDRTVGPDDVAIVFRAGSIGLWLPDSKDGEGIPPHIIAMIGMFHRLHTDSDFGKEMVEHVLGNPEVAEMFGIVIGRKDNEAVQ